MSSKLAVSIHILVLLAARQDALLTSEYIACSVSTNPVVIRRILGSLRRAGMVRSHPGQNGGWELARRPEAITLLDAFEAVEHEPVFALHPKQPNHNCSIGKSIQTALLETFDEVEQAMERQLASTSVADVLKRLNSV